MAVQKKRLPSKVLYKVLVEKNLQVKCMSINDPEIKRRIFSLYYHRRTNKDNQLESLIAAL